MFIKVKIKPPFEKLPFTTLEINKKNWKTRYFEKTDILILLKYYKVLNIHSTIKSPLKDYYLVSFKNEFFYIRKELCKTIKYNKIFNKPKN